MQRTELRSIRTARLAIVLGGITAPFALALRGAAGPPSQVAITTRASTGPAGMQADGESTGPSLSTDGRRLAFVTWATNLVVSDTNEQADVYVKDLATGTIQRASISSGGAQADGASFAPSLSGDGLLVAFASDASNLVPGDTNGAADVFVRDLTTGTTIRVSLATGGAQANAPSEGPSISPDGRFVAFTSHATNLVPGDTNDEPDVFVRDLQAGSTERVSVGVDGVQAVGMSEAATISGDGRIVAFASTAGNLLAAGVDTNRVWDVFVRDRLEGTTSRVSISTGGGQGDGHGWMPAISADGRFVAFSSRAANLVAGDTNAVSDVFVHDRETGVTTRVSLGPGGAEGDGASAAPSISSDGRFVTLSSSASNLVSGDTNGKPDVFVHDRTSGVTTRVSVGFLGQTHGVSLWPAISRDGRYVAFPDSAADLAPGDTNARLDVFVRGPLH